MQTLLYIYKKYECIILHTLHQIFQIMQDSTFYSEQSLLYMNTLNYYVIHISVLSEGITGKPKSDKYNINCNTYIICMFICYM